MPFSEYLSLKEKDFQLECKCHFEEDFHEEIAMENERAFHDEESATGNTR
jgi:hypothetical protein